MNAKPTSEPRTRKRLYNEAQRWRAAADTDVKKLKDMPDVHDGEKWGSPSGHSGTRSGWVATGVILAGFVVGAVGFTFGPRILLWLGIGIVVIMGAISLSTHAWTDFRPHR